MLKKLSTRRCCLSPDELTDCKTQAVAAKITDINSTRDFSFFVSQLYPRNCILTITAFLNELKGYSVIV